MWDIVVDIFKPAVLAVLTGFAGYLVRAIVKYITSHHLEKLAIQAVHFAEDMYKGFDGEDKLEAASEWVSKRLKKLHIKISADDIQEAVQSAYDYVSKGVEEGIEDFTSDSSSDKEEDTKPKENG